MSKKPNSHDATPSQLPNPIHDEHILTEGPNYEQLSVPKTIVLPSAQVPAEPPKPAQAPPKPSQSGATE